MWCLNRSGGGVLGSKPPGFRNEYLIVTNVVSDQVGSGQVRWKTSAGVWGLDFKRKRGRVSKKRSGQLRGFGVYILKGNCWSRGGVWSWLSGQVFWLRTHVFLVYQSVLVVEPGVLVNEAAVLVNEAGVYLAALLLRMGFQWSE